MLPSRFTGDDTSVDPSAWIVKFKDYVSLHRPEGSEILERMKYCTEGNARKWVDSVNVNSLNDLEQEFLHRFGLLHTREAVLQSLTQKCLTPGMSVYKYLNDIQDLVTRLGLP